MTTVQALIVGGFCGFIIGSITWMLVGLAFGILADGIPKALNDRLKIENKEEKNG